MLGKLIKYDFRCLIRKFGPLWLGAMALAVINGFTTGHVLESDSITGLLAFLLGGVPMIVMVSLWIALGVMMIVFVCERFYKGLLGDEGYLMFTLPAATGEHIASKLIVALVMELVTMLVGFVSILLFALVYDAASVTEFFSEFFRGLREYADQIPKGTGLFLFLVVVTGVVTTAVSDLTIYQSIALGHLARKNRVLASVLAYIGINIALTILISLLSPLTRVMGRDILDLLNGDTARAFIRGANQGMGALLVWNVITGAAFFIDAEAILEHKLNLE